MTAALVRLELAATKLEPMKHLVLIGDPTDDATEVRVYIADCELGGLPTNLRPYGLRNVFEVADWAMGNCLTYASSLEHPEVFRELFRMTQPDQACYSVFRPGNWLDESACSVWDDLVVGYW